MCDPNLEQSALEKAEISWVTLETKDSSAWIGVGMKEKKIQKDRL